MDDAEIQSNPLGLSEFEMEDEGWPTDEELETSFEILSKMPKKKLTTDDFEVGAPLGRGKFGHVYLCREVVSKVPVAVKVLFKSQLMRYGMENQLRREIEIQKKLSHPNILEMYTFFFDDKRIYLVLEFCTIGELYKELNKRGQFNAKDTCTVIGQIADALDYCHRNDVIHRDLKPENILLDEHEEGKGYYAKLADFGWSIHSKSHRSTLCGTKDYLPPELIHKKKYDHKVDNWCVGVLCYELMFGDTPFHQASDSETMSNITNVQYAFPTHFESGAKHLIGSLLKFNPTERLDLEKVVCHPWIKSNASNLPDGSWRLK